MSIHRSLVDGGSNGTPCKGKNPFSTLQITKEVAPIKKKMNSVLLVSSHHIVIFGVVTQGF